MMAFDQVVGRRQLNWVFGPGCGWVGNQTFLILGIKKNQPTHTLTQIRTLILKKTLKITLFFFF
jgi:hypothetical protein